MQPRWVSLSPTRMTFNLFFFISRSLSYISNANEVYGFLCEFHTGLIRAMVLLACETRRFLLQRSKPPKWKTAGNFWGIVFFFFGRTNLIVVVGTCFPTPPNPSIHLHRRVFHFGDSSLNLHMLRKTGRQVGRQTHSHTHAHWTCPYTINLIEFMSVFWWFRVRELVSANGQNRPDPKTEK